MNQYYFKQQMSKDHPYFSDCSTEIRSFLINSLRDICKTDSVRLGEQRLQNVILQRPPWEGEEGVPKIDLLVERSNVIF